MFYTDIKPRTPAADYDQGLVWTAVMLLAIGLVMVYSSSIAIAEASRATGYEVVRRRSSSAVFFSAQ